jgi:hypothetical protein
MLPDLWRMAHRHVRPAASARAPASSVRLEEVMEGIAHHGRADGAFHASASFQGGEKWISRALATVGAPRLPLFGHIAWELCLDGALVRREGRALLDEVRDAVESACEAPHGESAVDAAARIHHAARKGEPLPSELNARVGRMLTEVARGGWIEGYGHGAVVADRLGGIRARLGFAPLEEGPQQRLVAILDEGITRAEGEITALMALPV